MTPERFIEVFRLAALQAGRVASTLQGEVTLGEKAGETTLESAALTAVDLAAQDVLLLALFDAAPHVAVDAEEDTSLVERFAGAHAGAPLVVIDPIDGTLNYGRGSSDYAVMGGLIVRGLFEAVVVAFPAHSAVYAARRGGGAWVERAGAGRAPLTRAAAPSRVLVSPRVAPAVQSRLGAEFSEVSVSRCSAVDASVVALARAQASLAEGHSDRRRAIGYLLSSEVGGVTLLGDRVWRGEDPDTLPGDSAPSVTAESEAVARRVLLLARR